MIMNYTQWTNRFKLEYHKQFKRKQTLYINSIDKVYNPTDYQNWSRDFSYATFNYWLKLISFNLKYLRVFWYIIINLPEGSLTQEFPSKQNHTLELSVLRKSKP